MESSRSSGSRSRRSRGPSVSRRWSRSSASTITLQLGARSRMKQPRVAVGEAGYPGADDDDRRLRPLGRGNRVLRARRLADDGQVVFLLDRRAKHLAVEPLSIAISTGVVTVICSSSRRPSTNVLDASAILSHPLRSRKSGFAYLRYLPATEET